MIIFFLVILLVDKDDVLDTNVSALNIFSFFYNFLYTQKTIHINVLVLNFYTLCFWGLSVNKLYVETPF